MHILYLYFAAIHAESSSKRRNAGGRGRPVKELIPVIGIEFEDNICSTDRSEMVHRLDSLVAVWLFSGLALALQSGYTDFPSDDPIYPCCSEPTKMVRSAGGKKWWKKSIWIMPLSGK